MPSIEVVKAADISKADNLDNLTAGNSWDGGTAPGTGDIGVFDSVYTQSGSLNTGGLLEIGGIRVTSPSSAVVINNSSGGQEIAVGTSGIDLSTATQNLNIQRVRVDATQTWDVATGQQFVIGNSGSVRAGVLSTGVAGSTIQKTGDGTVQLDTSNTNIGNVNWDIQAGLVRAIWNTSSAWGTGNITLGGGGIAVGTNFTGSVGNWSWNNPITLTSSTSSFIDNQNIAGTNRWLNLLGVISGDGNVEFRDTGTGFTNANYGFLLSATNTNNGTLTIASGAEVRVGTSGASGSANTGNSGTLAGSTAPVVNNGTLSFSRLDSHTVPNAISGTGALRVGLTQTIGTATTSQNVTLSGASTYTGSTTVNNGTLTLTGSLSASSAVTVASAATLAGTGTAAGTVSVASGGILSPGVANSGTLTLGSLTFGGAASDTATIVMPVSAGGTLDSQLSVSGNLTANGGADTVTFDLGSNLALLANGTYTLTSYTGTLNDFTAFTFSGTTGGRQVVDLVNGTQSLDLQVSNAFVTWSGDQGSDWSAANNWILSSDSQPTTFQADDVVIFDDSGVTGTVDLTADVDPTTTTFSGDSLAYTVSTSGGFGIISGSLVKNGAATVTINTPNSFSGGTQLTAGTLILGDDSALGSGAVSVEGGSLDLNGSSIANDVVLGGGAIAGNGGAISGVISETGGAQSLVVDSAVTLSGSNTYSGGTTIQSGTLVAAASGSLGTAGTVTLADGTTGTADVGLLLDASAASVTISRAVDVSASGTGAVTIGSSAMATGTQAVFSGPISLGRSVTLTGAAGGDRTQFSGGISGTGDVTVTTAGSGRVILIGAANTFDGNVTISDNSRLQLSDGSGTSTSLIPDTASVTVGSGARLSLAKGNNSESIDVLLGSGTVESISGSNTLVVGSNNGSGSFSGTLVDNGGVLNLTKSGTGTQTLAGANTYTGLTRVAAGTLAYTGNNSLGGGLANASNQTSAVVNFANNTITIGNDGTNAGNFYYGTLDGTGTLQLQGGSGTVVTATGSTGSSTGNFQIFTTAVALSPTAFALDTGVSETNRRDFAYINENGTPLTLSSLSGYGAIRNDAGGASTRVYVVDQSVDTTFDGAIVSHRSSAGVQRLVSLEKQGSGSLTLAGFIGKQTASAQAGAAPVSLTANGGVLSVTNAENTTTANTDAINLGTVTVTSGVLAFSDQALVNTAGTAGASSILMNGGTLRWNTGTTQDLTVGGRLSFVPGATATFDTNGNDVTLGSFLGGDGTGSALVKAGTGTLTLGAASDLSGATTVSAGTLLVNASLSATSGLTVNSGAVFGGSGRVNAVISGAGLVSPGNSPGITRADAVDPSAGTSFAFEFTATGSPTYSDATASVNDVLRLDDATTPFVANLSGSNVVDVYFDVTTLTGGDTFKGGFFTDLASDFTSSVENGTYAYWVKGDGTGSDRTFNGQGYFSLANFDAGLSVNLATVAETADFVGGTVNGQVTEFSVVPEPATIALVAAAAGLFAAVRHRWR